MKALGLHMAAPVHLIPLFIIHELTQLSLEDIYCVGAHYMIYKPILLIHYLIGISVLVDIFANSEFIYHKSITTRFTLLS